MLISNQNIFHVKVVKLNLRKIKSLKWVLSPIRMNTIQNDFLFQKMQVMEYS